MIQASTALSYPSWPTENHQNSPNTLLISAQIPVLKGARIQSRRKPYIVNRALTPEGILKACANLPRTAFFYYQHQLYSRPRGCAKAEQTAKPLNMF